MAEEVRIEGTEGLGLQHLYRSMDFLEANQDALEQAIYFRTADLLNLDVELVFYDTGSAPKASSPAASWRVSTPRLN